MTHPLRLVAPAVALAGLLASAAPAAAGWDNVFQLCCNDCKPRVSFFNPCPDPCPKPCPQPEVRVSYVQRCYYQPVTELRRETYYTPVEERVRSYYWEPVCSYRYSCYIDPCTGCPQQIATPVKSYRLREKCNTVTRWVERCRMVPVTSYRAVTTLQPVVSYYYPPQPSCPPSSGPGLPFAPADSLQPAPGGPPRVDELRQNPPTVLPDRPGDSNIPRTDFPTNPGSYPRAMPARPNTGGRTGVNFASRERAGTLRGDVVLNDRQTPRANAKIIFVSAAKSDVRRSVVANEFGEFDTDLPAGDWYIYLGTGDGRAVYHKKVTVQEYDNPTYRVVSR
jgi:hypothetical protein